NSSDFPSSRGSDLDAWVLKLGGGTGTLPPAPPVVTAVSTDSGVSSTDQITNDATLVVSGTAQASSTVKVYRDQVYAGSTTANTGRVWPLHDAGFTLPEGGHQYPAPAPASSLTSKLSKALTVEIDLTAPVVTAEIDEETESLAPSVHVVATDLVGLGTPTV